MIKISLVKQTVLKTSFTGEFNKGMNSMETGTINGHEYSKTLAGDWRMYPKFES